MEEGVLMHPLFFRVSTAILWVSLFRSPQPAWLPSCHAGVVHAWRGCHTIPREGIDGLNGIPVRMPPRTVSEL